MVGAGMKYVIDRLAKEFTVHVLHIPTFITRTARLKCPVKESELHLKVHNKNSKAQSSKLVSLSWKLLIMIPWMFNYAEMETSC